MPPTLPSSWPLLLFNFMAHGAACMLALVLGVLLLRDHRQRIASRLGATLAFQAAAFAVVLTPTVAYPLTPWHAPLMALSVSYPFTAWLFSRSLLDDEFKLRRWHLVGWGALAALGVLPCFAVMPAWTEIRFNGLAFALPAVGLALLTGCQAFVHWREDLVESRRRLRLVIVAAVGGYMLLVHGFILTRPGYGQLGLPGNTLQAVGMGGLTLLLLWRMTRLRPDLYDDARPLPAPDPLEAAQAADAPPKPPRIEMPEPRFLDLLHELMTVEQVYREENLTIGALAQRMKLTEPRLRLLINQKLGHRNFNAFLNTYRIEDAKRALADPRQSEVPILTISMEAGFQSLGPFNRAFKALTGMTPSEFRRAAAEGADVARHASMASAPS